MPPAPPQDLTVTEFHEAMRRMGQTLSPDDTAEVMAELDLDGGGTIHVNEFLDKVRQSNNERAADAKRCKQIFAQCDDDGSGDPPTALPRWAWAAFSH